MKFILFIDHIHQPIYEKYIIPIDLFLELFHYNHYLPQLHLRLMR